MELRRRQEMVVKGIEVVVVRGQQTVVLHRRHRQRLCFVNVDLFGGRCQEWLSTEDVPTVVFLRSVAVGWESLLERGGC